MNRAMLKFFSVEVTALEQRNYNWRVISNVMLFLFADNLKIYRPLNDRTTYDFHLRKTAIRILIN